MGIPEYEVRRDVDTKLKGVAPPFSDFEADHTGLVHILWAAKRDGLTLAEDADEIASMIMRSRWLAANRCLFGPASAPAADAADDSVG